MLRLPILRLLVIFTSIHAHGQPLQIDTERTELTLSGTVAGATLREQAPGSLVTSLEGTIEIEVEGSTIRIVTARMAALNNGSWAPAVGGEAGTAPANFGARATMPLGVTANGAVRDVVLALESPALTMTEGSFPARELTFTIAPGTIAALDYSAGFFGSGREVLEGASTNETATTGMLSEEGGSQTLTILVDTTFQVSLLTENDTDLRLVGQIVAVEAAVAAPEFRSVEVVDGQVQLTVENGGTDYRLQSSTTLKAWTDRTPAVEEIDPATTLYTLPADKDWEFFRLVQ